MSEQARPLMMPEGQTLRGEAPARGRAKKAPSAFRTISEVADQLHIPQHVLRFWETKFQQVKPLKRGGGRRYYRPEDIRLLRQISDLLYIQGYTIKGVQRLLREGGGKLGDNIPPPDAAEREEPQPAMAKTPSAEPELPMPGLIQPPPAPRAAKPAKTGTEAEVERLRSLLNEALTELEALRALLR
jgi:DNA-binding transcriptional MerR regulator